MTSAPRGRITLGYDPLGGALDTYPPGGDNRSMTTTYTPRHRHPDVDHVYEMFDPSDPRDAYEVEEVREVLQSMPLDPEALGDGGTSDWTLSILFALAGRGDEDAHAYLAPRIAAAAESILRDIGWPGDAFQGA